MKSESIRSKLLGLFLLTSALPIILLGYWSIETSREALQTEVEDALNSIVDQKLHEIEASIEIHKNNLAVLGRSSAIINAHKQLAVSFMDGAQSAGYLAKNTLHIPLLNIVQESAGYYDLFLISLEGDVVFSIKHETDFATNMKSGPYQNSELARVYKHALADLDTGISKHLPYAPSNEQYAAFMATPIFDGGTPVGVLAVQFEADAFSRLSADYAGLGKTGEIVMAVHEGREAVIVAPLRFDQEAAFTRSIAIGSKSGKPIQQAVQGDKSSGQLIDYRGEEVLAAWRFLPSLNWGIVAKIDTHEAFQVVNQQVSQILLFGCGLFVIVALVGVFFARRLSQPIISLEQATRTMVDGDISKRIDIVSNDEVGQLAKTYNHMLDDLQEIVDQAHRIMRGDLRRQIEPRSERDELGLAIQSTTNSLREIVDVVGLVSQGDYAARVGVMGQDDRIGLGINGMIGSLQYSDWLDKGRNKVNQNMWAEDGLSVQPNNIISALCGYLNAHVGTIFFVSAKTLNMVGQYAHSNEARAIELAFGEGLVGQAAQDKKPVIFKDVPDDYTNINSSLGSIAPQHLLIFPFIHKGEVQAVMELGSTQPFSDRDFELLQQLSIEISMAVIATNAQEQQKALMMDALEQAVILRESEEKLQEQQEELQANNEELIQQASELTKSKENLQQQREELRVINEELEEQKRNVIGKNTALEKSRQEAEEKATQIEQASKYKSEFLANMSHELRTPLNSLLILAKGFADNDEDNLSDDQIEAASIIHGSGQELLELINDILDLSKIEAGKMTLYGSNMELPAFSSQIMRQFKHVAENKGLAFSVSIDEGLPASIYTDEGKVGQIAKNLLSNAFKFTRQGSVEVRMQLPPEALRSNYAIALAVTDSGIGISEDKQALIFEAFQQADGGTSRNFGGTGLGLSICREMSRLMGGEIQIESTPGVGSTFSLYLPQDLPESASDSSVGEAQTPDLSPNPALSLMTQLEELDEAEVLVTSDDRDNIESNDVVMLVIEDDQAFAGIVVDLVRKKGFKCLAAGTGRSGVQLALRYQPVGILLDLGLPDMDGFSVIEQLKQTPDTRHIPVHVLSARDSLEAALHKGAIGTLTKPVSQEQLDGALSRIQHFGQDQVRELLVVEDDNATQKVIQRLVGGDQVAAKFVTSGQEALERLAEQTFDCVILDLGLPDMDGIDLVERMATNEATAQTPVIVYSARELSEEEFQRLSTYTDSIIVKGQCSSQRLVDEVALFMHSVSRKLPSDEKAVLLESAQGQNSDLAGNTILLVDDDMRNTYALSRSLKKQKMNVIIAQDGAKALQKIQDHPEVDAILMDVMMPEMDGHETTRRIRQMPSFSKLPIIALTAHAMAEDREKCLQAGASDYMSKPVDVDRLLALLRVWICK